MGKPLDTLQALQVLGIQDSEIVDTVTAPAGVDETGIVAVRGTVLFAIVIESDGVRIALHDHDSEQEAQECGAWKVDTLRDMVAEYEATVAQVTAARSQLHNLSGGMWV